MKMGMGIWDELSSRKRMRVFLRAQKVRAQVMHGVLLSSSQDPSGWSTEGNMDFVFRVEGP
jgi:hypothetical protein